ncbi:uncharacterized protein slc19a3a isoform 2-T2 [Spinachia spinachia]
MEALGRWRADWKYPTALLCIYGFFSTVKPLEPFLTLYLTGPDKNLTTEQRRGSKEVSEGHLLLPQCPAAGVHSGLCAGPAAGQLGAHVLQPHPRAHSGSHGRGSSRVLPPANAGPQHVLSPPAEDANGGARGAPRRGRRREAGDGGAGGRKEMQPSARPAVGGLPPVLLLQTAALLVSVVGAGHMRLQPDGQLRPGAVGARAAVSELQRLQRWRGGSVQPVGCSNSLRYRLHRGEVGAVGGAGPRGLLWTRGRCTLPHDLHRQHLGLLRRLRGFQVPVHAFDNNSHVRASRIQTRFIEGSSGRCAFQQTVLLTRYQIAADLSMERYALVFGANNFGALALQTVITSVVVDSGGLGLGIIPQFTVYASYFSVIAVVFSLRGLFTVWRSNKSQQSTSPGKEEPPDSEEHRF